jgi:RNA polymerase sigma-70 factor (ECF subfamily)
MNSSNSDHTWQHIFGKNPEEGFRLIFEDYYAPLVLVANHFLQDLSESEDVVQQLFVKLWEKKRFSKITVSLESYLYVSVRNACYNIIQSRKQTVQASAAELVDRKLMQSMAFLLDQECAEILEKAICMLPDQNRRAFELVYVEKQSYQQAAEAMEITVNTIKYHLKQALKILRENQFLHDYFCEKEI